MRAETLSVWGRGQAPEPLFHPQSRTRLHQVPTSVLHWLRFSRRQVFSTMPWKSSSSAGTTEWTWECRWRLSAACLLLTRCILRLCWRGKLMGRTRQDLLPQHGFPLRLIVPSWYGMASVKWLRAITVSDDAFQGVQVSEQYRYKTSASDPGTPVREKRVNSVMTPPGIPDLIRPDHCC